jgi:hypothetical protein
MPPLLLPKVQVGARAEMSILQLSPDSDYCGFECEFRKPAAAFND